MSQWRSHPDHGLQEEADRSPAHARHTMTVIRWLWPASSRRWPGSGFSYKARPVQNGYVESFNGPPARRVSEREWFWSLEDAQQKLGKFREALQSPPSAQRIGRSDTGRVRGTSPAKRQSFYVISEKGPQLIQDLQFRL
jgi:Integrase core domain